MASRQSATPMHIRPDLSDFGTRNNKTGTHRSLIFCFEPQSPGYAKSSSSICCRKSSSLSSHNAAGVEKGRLQPFTPSKRQGRLPTALTLTGRIGRRAEGGIGGGISRLTGVVLVFWSIAKRLSRLPTKETRAYTWYKLALCPFAPGWCFACPCHKTETKPDRTSHKRPCARCRRNALSTIAHQRRPT